MATGRPTYGDRFHTANEESALLARGFQHGTQPGALVIGWNSYHTAVTLPDGTNVASGERGGVRIGGQGAYQPQFTHHMYLPMSQEAIDAMDDAIGAQEVVEELPAPEQLPAPVEELPPPVEEPVVVDAPVEDVPVETAA